MFGADAFGAVLSAFHVNVLECLGYRRIFRIQALSDDGGEHLIDDQKSPLITSQSILEPKRTIVRLPDLFCPSFGIIRNPAINPHYEEVRAESEAWLAQ